MDFSFLAFERGSFGDGDGQLSSRYNPILPSSPNPMTQGQGDSCIWGSCVCVCVDEPLLLLSSVSRPLIGKLKLTFVTFYPLSLKTIVLISQGTLFKKCIFVTV